MIKNNSLKEAGFAAILTLWLIVITATIVVTYYYVILEEYRVIHNYKNSGAAEFYAVGAINKVIGYIMDNRQDASSLTQPIITEVRGRINDGGLDKYYEFIEIYNPTLNNIDLSANYKLKMEVAGLGSIDSALISWSSISNVSVGMADTTTTILAPGCYAVILSPSFGLDTTYKDNYDTIIPSTAIVLALQGDIPGNYLGNLSIGGKSTASIPGLADHVVISEVCIGGANGGGTDDEFVELYNPTSSAVSLTGWLLRRETSSGGDNAYVTLSGTIQPFGFYLIAGRNYVGDSDIQRTAGSGYFAQDNQAVLKNASGVIIDAVGWGTLTGGSYEGSPAPDFTGTATGNSLERKAFDTSTLTSMTSGADLTKGNGHDSNNNNNDFIYRTTNNPQKTGDFEYPSTAGMENNKRTVIELYYSTTKISVVELDTGTGYILSTAGASLERTNFRAGSTTSYDPGEWVEIKGISSDSHIIPGTPGSLNLSVKFSTSKTSSLPYIFPYSSWWDLEEDIDNDGDTDFKIVARPSLSRFNVNHKLNKFNAYDSGILHSISFYEYPNYSDTDILLNMLSLIAYDGGSGKKGLV
ncbi:MAG TPA: lamin tail domain-containing protein, partial [bacterium]|nr:lamin tail domain-containing protein [bacterium]